MKILPSMSDVRPIVSLNLFLTRQIVTVVILFISVCCVLFPASILTYLSFRKSLIPMDRVQVPVNFLDTSERALKRREIDTREVLPYLERNKNLTFAVNLNLHGICKIETSHQVFSYLLELPGTASSTSIAHQDMVLVNCDSRYIYAKKNWLVPYNLRYWVPPIAVNVMKMVDMQHQMVKIKGHELQKLLEQGNPAITLSNMNFLFLDPKVSSVDFVVLWEGFRFYLVNYYGTSLLLGTLLFWVPSSFICIGFALIVSFYLKSGQEISQVKPKFEKQPLDEDAPAIKQE